MTTIALTGASGNMGREVLRELCSLPDVKVRFLHYGNKGFAVKALRRYKNTEVVYGNIADENVCEKLIDGADYVINCAAVIPPLSDKYPERAVECNYYGVKSLLDAIKRGNKDIKLIHISTVAVYGNRNHIHPWGKVGDPLMPSPFDVYSRSKVFGERLVVESGLKNWVVLRQTAMLHERMLADNMSDGLMFHTCLNAPLEWVTAKDSGILIKNIIRKDIAGETDGFWRRIFNIGGGKENRITGFDTFNDGFAIIGGSAKLYLNPSWMATRNFHGVWFYDSDELEKMFSFQNQNCSDYWQEILKKHPYYKIAKIIPPSVIRKLAIVRLLNDDNAPEKWRKNGELAKLEAYFYDGKKATENWAEFPLLKEGKTEEGDIDYESLRDIDNAERKLLSNGIGNKSADELTIEDMKRAAEFRGGKCLSDEMKKGDMYTPLMWECSEGHRFFATPYAVIFGGHWCEECLKDGWNYDYLSKKNPFYAQVWCDTHKRDENNFYYFEKGTAKLRRAI